MSRSLRIPGLIDLVRADTRSDIRGLANDSRLDRRFEARGPLINRILVERIRNVLRIDGVPLPSVAPRQDAERVRTQDTLRRRLELWVVAQQNVLHLRVRDPADAGLRIDLGTEVCGEETVRLEPP